MSAPASNRLSLAALCEPSPAQGSSSSSSSSTATSSLSTVHPLPPQGSPSPKDSRKMVSPQEISADNAATSLQPRSLSEEDESVMIAVRALDDMRSRPVPQRQPTFSSQYHQGASQQATPDLSAASTATSPSIPEQSLSHEIDTAPNDFVSRVSGLPIVNTALRKYEQSKASSRFVKYGAEMVESSMKTISKPVIDILPVNQLDEFACRQLDRIGKYTGSSSARSPSLSGRDLSDDRGRRSDESDRTSRLSREESRSRSTYSRDVSMDRLQNGDDDQNPSQSQEIATRSRWHSLLYEAGGIGAAVSDESMRRLRYCLQWLQYATDHIDGQILVLRNFINSLSVHDEDGGELGEERPISASHMQTLTNVKRDVIKTIRQVVDVVSKYAGGALPEPARDRVRQFILHLPQRWATSAHRQTHLVSAAPAHTPNNGVGPNRRRRRGDTLDSISAASTAPSSPAQSPRIHTGLPLPAVLGATPRSSRPTTGTATQAAQRILTLATESLDMMRSVTGVFKESLDRADVWVERLRLIGIQRQQRPEDASDDDLPPPITGEESTMSPLPTPLPSSPRSWTSDMPSSPGGLAASSLDGLSLSSTYATPKSSTSSLPTLADYSWDYLAAGAVGAAGRSKGVGAASGGLPSSEVDDVIGKEGKPVERTAVSAIRGTMTSPPGLGMDVDAE